MQRRRLIGAAIASSMALTIAVSVAVATVGLPPMAHAAPMSATPRTFTGIDATADGQGYGLISDAGEVYAFGSLRYRANPAGFTGRITGLSTTADGQGYVAVSSAGQVYAYGTVQYRGNPAGFTGGIVGISATADGQGYAAVSGSGQVYAYGTVLYRGNGDPGPTSGSDLRSRIVDVAQREANDPSHNREIGGANCNYYTTALNVGSPCSNGWRSRAWCADFARWVWAQVGANTGGLSGLAISFKSYGTNHGTWHPGNLAGVQPGDVVGYNFGTSSTADDHVGIVVSVNPNGTVNTIEGNYSDRVKAGTAPRSDKTVSGYTSPVG
jgi:hypothetical protein